MDLLGISYKQNDIMLEFLSSVVKSPHFPDPTNKNADPDRACDDQGNQIKIY